ncbi:glycosyltransferase family 39 protein [Arthrobacter celericrescens]|uniref:glycosyltransferase family 39 protein n=1 Tax=Arthrobacter celericrescens TaxID=2320851 RepID=UPI000EA0377B|nr:glycosyltransferase family 39 protein [Arthrobacter celericrescens]
MTQLARTGRAGTEGTRFREKPHSLWLWAIGLLGFLVPLAKAWVPSFWNDEITTISAARRSPEQLFELLKSVDAVHGAYYLLMHFWTSLFEFSELSMRLPSAIAVGLACAGTVVIGRKLGNEFVGLGAGLVLVFLPRMVWAGTEARQSALIALFAVALTLFLIRAWNSGHVIDWVLYSVCAAAGVYVFMFFALAIAAHVVAAVLLRRRVLAVLVSALAAAIAASPFLLFALGQKGQVAWIQDRSLLQNIQAIAVKQFFYGDDRPTGNLPPGWVLGAVVVLGLLQLGLAVLGLIHSAGHTEFRGLAVLAACAVAVPIGVLLLVSILVQPVYVPRYLTFTAPMFALLVGLGLDKVRSLGSRKLAAAAALVLLAGLPQQLTLKSLVNGPRDTERHVAALLDADGPGPAAVVYGRPEDRDPALAYPASFSRLTDLSLKASPEESGTLWGVNKEVTAAELEHRGRVYFIGSGTGPTPDPGAFQQAGCTQTRATATERLRFVVYDCS